MQVNMQTNNAQVAYRTPIRAIRVYCLNCCCGSRTDVRKCTAVNCSLYPYRMGHRPRKAERSSLNETPQIARGFSDECGRTGSFLSVETGDQKLPSNKGV